LFNTWPDYVPARWITGRFDVMEIESILMYVIHQDYLNDVMQVDYIDGHHGA
jgi:hypothetical protein